MRLHESRTLSIPTDTLTKWYVCDGHPELSTHGTVVVVLAARPGGFTGSLGLNITLEWKVQFTGIEMPGESAALDDVIQPDSGWTNLFSTSDGSFNAERLTLKMHSGGDMAPFSAARQDHIYVLTSGESLQYYDESSQLKQVPYFARVQNFSVPGLLCFATREDAKAYITGGDITKAIKYTKAGPVGTPAILKFKGGEAKDITEIPPARSISELRELINAIHQSKVSDVPGKPDDVVAWTPWGSFYRLLNLFNEVFPEPRGMSPGDWDFPELESPSSQH